MDNLALRHVYEQYTLTKSTTDFESLWTCTRLFLVKKLQQWKPKSNKIEDVVHWTIMKLIKKVDQLTEKDKLEAIENFEAYSITTAKRQLIKRENEDRRGIVHNQYQIIDQNQEVNKNDLHESYQINTCLRKLVFAASQSLLTKTEKIIIEGLVRHSRGASTAKDYAPISRKIRSKVQAELKMKSPTFSNHMKRISEKFVQIEPANCGDSFEGVVNYLITQARKLKHQEDYYAALILYHSIALIEPKYWNAIKDPRTLNTQGRFWEALYNIGYCLIRTGQLGLAILEYAHFIENLKRGTSTHYSLLSTKDVIISNSEREEKVLTGTFPTLNRNSVIIGNNILKSSYEESKALNMRHYFLGKSLNQLGTVYLKMNLHKSIDAFLEGAHYIPEDMVIYCNLLETYILCGDITSARRIYEQRSQSTAFIKVLKLLPEEIFSQLKKEPWFRH